MSATTLPDRIERIRERISAACARSGRAGDEVTLVAVSKTVERPVIEEAMRLGLTHFGENRVLDARGKLTDPPLVGATLHLIGQLQTNKAAPAVDLFDVIESVDRASLISELTKQGAKRSRKIDVLLQVNVAKEEQKAGCAPKDAPALVEAILGSEWLQLRGLMTIAPLESDPEAVRPVFQGVRQLRDDLAGRYPQASLTELSMGMTSDFEVAIEEGSTEVRVGRAIFG